MVSARACSRSVTMIVVVESCGISWVTENGFSLFLGFVLAGAFQVLPDGGSGADDENERDAVTVDRLEKTNDTRSARFHPTSIMQENGQL